MGNGKTLLVPTPPNSATPWIILTLGALLATVVAGVVALGVFGPPDKLEILIAALVGIVGTIVPLLVTSLMKLGTLHVMLNSQAAEARETILALTTEVVALKNFQQGVVQGQTMQKAAAVEEGARNVAAIAEAKEVGRELGVASASPPPGPIHGS